MGRLRRAPGPDPRPREVGRIAAPSTTSRARALARALVASLLLATSCTAHPADGTRPRSPGASGAVGATAASPEGPGHADPSLPDPDARIPRDARELAERLGAELRALDRAIERWRTEGDPSTWPPPREVELGTLFVQRVYRTLARDLGLTRRVLERLPRARRFEVQANVSASAALFAGSRPVPSAEGFRTARPEPAGVLLGWFREAERRFGVDHELLAAVMLIETRFGRVVSRSSAGASGPMQFIPSTWAAYGLGGDVRDPHDAIMGAANYLRAAGARRNERGALYAYNPVDAYVRAVSSYARVMRRNPNAYFAYYNWQVFVRTVDGDVRLTGPGR